MQLNAESNNVQWKTSLGCDDQGVPLTFRWHYCVQELMGQTPLSEIPTENPTDLRISVKTAHTSQNW